MRSMIASLLILLLGNGAALAHAFNLLLVVPADDPVADDMRRAVLLAAEERDGHPDNHSDGHLGGLDVYVTLSTGLSDPDNWAEAEPDIVLDVLHTPVSIHMDDDPEWLAIFGPQLGRLDRDAVLGAAADPAFPPFAARFRAATGRDPGPEAEAAYLGARLIDLIVRPLDDASDPAALFRELDRLD